MEPAPPAPFPVVLSYPRAAQMADVPDNCYRCAYPLLGIDDESPCPECGLLARRSRRSTDELHNTRPRWLARLSRGANLILLAAGVALAWPFVWDWGRSFAYSLFGNARFWLALPWLGIAAGALLLLAGVTLLTSKEGYFPADRADHRLRAMLRLAACVPLLAVGLHALRGLLFQIMPSMSVAARVELSTWIDHMIWMLATVGCAPLPLLLFLHLRGLAKRARSAHLAEHCLIVGIGLSIVVVLLALYGVFLANIEHFGMSPHWMNRSTAALLIVLTFAVAMVLFALWSLYLFIRFTLAFRRAANEMRGRWTSDDRSLAPAAMVPADG